MCDTPKDFAEDSKGRNNKETNMTDEENLKKVWDGVK